MNNRNLFIVLVVVILVLAGAYAFMQYQQNQEVTVSLNNSQASNGANDYTNSDYGFKLTLNSAWSGYRVFKLGSDSVSSYDVCVKTTDTSYATANPDQAGFACPVSVFAIKDAAWSQMADLERNSFGEPTDTKDGVRFFVTPWQSAPADLAGQDFAIESVVNSFKF